MSSSPPVQIPPSAGGTGLATIAGLLLGWNLAHGLGGAGWPALDDWLPGLGLLLLVVGLLGGMQRVRRRLGVVAAPEALRRQWVIVGVGLLAGLLGGGWLGMA